eukprot:Skav204715  [mRNA]  locus=scaffold1549:103965:108002:- [translate_table: standard]
MQKPEALQQLQQMKQEWRAITHADGFQPTFIQWVLSWPNFQHYHVDLPTVEFVFDLEQVLRHHCDQAVVAEETRRKKLLKYHAHYDVHHQHAKNVSRNIRDAPMPPLQKVPTSINVEAILLSQEHGLVTCKLPNAPWNLRATVQLQGHAATIVSVESDIAEFMIHDSEQVLPSEFSVTQSDETTDPQTIATALDEYWQQFWGRDPTATSDDPHHWSEFEQFLADVPAIPECEVKLNDLEAWKQAIATTKTSSARGVDGWSIEEFRALPDAALQALANIFEHWYQHGISWPSYLMQAVTIPLGKIPEPCSPAHTRPITILAIVYRWWAKVICRQVLWHWSATMPDSIVGFIPTRSATTYLFGFQHQLEQQHGLPKRQQTPIGGLTLDLKKCFNTLPRYPASRAMVKAGIPEAVVHQWAASQKHMTRLWQVEGGLYPGQPNTTGCPEGDTFSILACISLAYVWQYWLTLMNLLPFVFADNWAWRGHSIVSHRRAIDYTQKFCNSLKLQIDWQKTWTWSTDSTMKKQWKKIAKDMVPEARFKVLASARELGFQIHYTRVQDRSTQRLRHHQALRRLKRLQKQKVDLNTKGLMAHYAMQKALYSVETYYVGKKWLRELRTASTQALMPDRMHANPFLACHLIAKTLRDPEHFVILHSLRATRRYLATVDQSTLHKFCQQVAHHTLQPQKVHGPAGALAMNLARIGWMMNQHGTISTDTKVEFHILRTCPKLIESFLAYSWSKHIVQTALTRPQWQGLPAPDQHATGDLLHSLEPSSHHIVAREILGVYHGTSQKQHYKPEDQACPFCEHPQDDSEHRLLHCTATAHVRNQHPILHEHLEEMSDIWIHMPVLFHDHMYEFRTWIHQNIPPPEWNDSILHDILDHQKQGHHLHFWTDGACMHPTQPAARKAAFAAVWHPTLDEADQMNIVQRYFIDKHIPSSFQTAFVGLCQGEQTVPRAELQAAAHLICMLADVIDEAPPEPIATLWTDSMYVVQIIGKIAAIDNRSMIYNLTNADHLYPLQAACRRGLVQIKKIKAHMVAKRPTEVTFFHLGNEAADHAAGTALNTFASFADMYPDIHELRTQHDQMKQIYQYMIHLQHVRAQLRKQLPAPTREADDWQTKLQQLREWNTPDIWQMDPLQIPEVLSACTWGTAHAHAMVTWLATVRWEANPSPATERIGTTWYELCFAYLEQTRNPMPINVGGNGADFLPRYVYPTDEQQNFAQLVYTFERTITQLQQLTGQPLVPSTKRTAMGLTLLGNTHGAGGVAARCVYPDCERIWNHLRTHFWSQSVMNDPRSYRFPGYTSEERTSSWALHTTDHADYHTGWVARFRRYTAARKNAAKLKKSQV